jgi:hypothetical protein
MNQKKLDIILRKHKRWLDNLVGGERANLYKADLREADLHKADLREADLRGANLYMANLYKANLYKADLYKADLYKASLREADLRGANLYMASLYKADLYKADLREADLCEADLCEAKNIPDLFWTIIVPEGELVVWKKLCGGLCQLLIPKEARRSNGIGRKCRAEFAVVLSVTPGDKIDYSIHDHSFVYKEGERVVCDKWEENRWNECGGGIHFFLTKQEAESYPSS